MFSKTPYSTNYDIWVGDIKADVSEFDLSIAFSRCGEIKKTKIIKTTESNLAYGFVSFATEEAKEIAANECNGINVGGKPVVVKRASDRSEKAAALLHKNPSGLRSPASYNSGLAPFQQKLFPVFVGSVPRDVSEVELKDYFSAFGLVKYARIFVTNDPTAYGFVNFIDERSQQKALSAKTIRVDESYVQILPSRSNTNSGPAEDESDRAYRASRREEYSPRHRAREGRYGW